MSRQGIHIDPNHPVYPDAQKITARVITLEHLTAHEGFQLTPAFITAVGMRSTSAGCLCASGAPHRCCGECLHNPNPLHSTERATLTPVLLGFNPLESHAPAAAEQALLVLIHNIPLTLFLLSRSRGISEVGALFFANVACVGAFIDHMGHAAARYSSHEDFLHSSMWVRMAVGSAVGRIRGGDGVEALMAGYLGGGVGVGRVRLKGWEVGTAGWGREKYGFAVWVGGEAGGALVVARVGMMPAGFGS